MSTGTKYIVEIDLDVTGDLPGEMGKIGSALDRTEGKTKSLGKELGSLGSQLASGFTGVVETVGSSLITLGKVGIAAAIGGATYGVMSLNQELETTRVSLAAVLNSNGLTSNIEDGMERAAGWVAQMKRDARDLPGEFSDLLGIVQSGAGAAFKAGLDDVSFEKLAANAMAAAKALATPMDQAGREMAHLLTGHAGAQNVFGTRLGLTAENYNTKSQAEQIKMLTAALDKFQPAIKVFGATMDAQSSTLVDNVKSFTTNATLGLSQRVVGALTEVNTWFENNQYTVKLWSDKVSQFLVDSWDDGRRIIEEWGPSIIDFAGRFYDKFMATWRQAEPYAKDIASAVKSFLDNPESLDRIEKILKLYASVKIIGAGVDIAKGGAGLFNSLGGLGKALGIGGAAAKTAATATADASVAAEWAAAVKAASLSGQASEAVGAAATAGAGTTALITGVVAATVAALGAAGYEVYSAQQHSATMDAKGGGAYGYSAGAQTYVDKQVDAAIAAGGGAERKYRTTMSDWQRDNRVEDMVASTYGLHEWSVVLAQMKIDQRHAADEMESFARTAYETSEAMGQLQFIINGLAKSGDFEAIAKINAGIMRAQDDVIKEADASARNMDTMNYLGMMNASQAIASIDAKASKDKEAALAKAKAAAAGSGNTIIQRVEITVSSNQAPGQIARDVAKKLTDMKRYRRSSASTLNVSAGR